MFIALKRGQVIDLNYERATRRKLYLSPIQEMLLKEMNRASHGFVNKQYCQPPSVIEPRPLAD